MMIHSFREISDCDLVISYSLIVLQFIDPETLFFPIPGCLSWNFIQDPLSLEKNR